MRVVIAPQGLKGSLTAAEVGRAIALGVQTVYPGAEIVLVPVADGGEGTVQALVDTTKGELVWETVTGPLGTPVSAFFGVLGDGRTAALEMAACAGLPLVPHAQRDPRITTTYGVGELLLTAIGRGCRHIILGIGGSATNDGGAGMMQALGASLQTAENKAITHGGAALTTLSHISVEQLDTRLRDCVIEVACDVTNPLCGPTGASAVYGPQKGATSAMVRELDAALNHYATLIERDLGAAIRDIPGAGAAGGLGAGLLAFLHAQLRPGAQLILEAVKLEDALRTANLVITAEGQIDAQTASGKSVGAVATLAKRYNIPVLALTGGLGAGYQNVYPLGVDGIAVLPSGPMTLPYAIEHAAALTTDATERMLRVLRLNVKSNQEV